MKRMITLVLAVLMLVSVAAMSGCDESVSTLLSNKPEAEPKGAASAEYTKVFEDAGIAAVDTPMAGQSYAAYVYVNEDGDVYRQEYGYLGDTIMTMVDTYYYYIPEDSDTAAVEQYKGEINQLHDPVNDMTCASVSYSTLACLNGGEFYVVRETYDGLDKTDAVEELEKAGLVEEGTLFVSMEMTAESLIEMGCIER